MSSVLGAKDRELGADDVGRQPFVLDGGDDAVDELVAALDHQGRVRDLESERMAEEGGDGEPIGDAADHGGLEAGCEDGEPGPAGPEAVGERDRHTAAPSTATTSEIVPM